MIYNMKEFNLKEQAIDLGYLLWVVPISIGVTFRPLGFQI
jgi:hypothetical protein